MVHKQLRSLQVGIYQIQSCVKQSQSAAHPCLMHNRQWGTKECDWFRSSNGWNSALERRSWVWGLVDGPLPPVASPTKLCRPAAFTTAFSSPLLSHIHTVHVTSYLNFSAEIRGLPSRNSVNIHESFRRACTPTLQTGRGNVPTAKRCPQNTVVSRSQRDRFHPPRESGLATRD